MWVDRQDSVWASLCNRNGYVCIILHSFRLGLQVLVWSARRFAALRPAVAATAVPNPNCLKQRSVHTMAELSNLLQILATWCAMMKLMERVGLHTFLLLSYLYSRPIQFVVNDNPFMCCRSLIVIYAPTLVTMQTEAVKSDVGRKIARL